MLVNLVLCICLKGTQGVAHRKMNPANVDFPPLSSSATSRGLESLTAPKAQQLAHGLQLQQDLSAGRLQTQLHCLQGNRTRRASFGLVRLCKTKWKLRGKRTLPAGSMREQAGETALCYDEEKFGQRAAKATNADQRVTSKTWDCANRNGTQNDASKVLEQSNPVIRNAPRTRRSSRARNVQNILAQMPD